jgi:hypothetical protein
MHSPPFFLRSIVQVMIDNPYCHSASCVIQGNSHGGYSVIFAGNLIICVDMQSWTIYNNIFQIPHLLVWPVLGWKSCIKHYGNMHVHSSYLLRSYLIYQQTCLAVNPTLFLLPVMEKLVLFTYTSLFLSGKENHHLQLHVSSDLHWAIRSKIEIYIEHVWILVLQFMTSWDNMCLRSK